MVDAVRAFLRAATQIVSEHGVPIHHRVLGSSICWPRVGVVAGGRRALVTSVAALSLICSPLVPVYYLPRTLAART
jgi:hypothetical protein